MNATHSTRMRLMFAAVILALSGCAQLPPLPDSMKPIKAPPAPAPAPASGSPATSGPAATAQGQTPVPGSAAPAPGAVGVPADSTPSAAAKAVLESIPEPLTAAERALSPAGRAASDSSAAEPPEAAGEGPPVPAPTRPLGEQPGDSTARALPDSIEALLRGGSASGSSPPASSAPATPPRAPAAAPDTCWRVQLVAPRDRETAELKRRAAESLLTVSATIEASSTLFKVRTRDCASREVATALRARAIASGFDGAFLIGEKAK